MKRALILSNAVGASMIKHPYYLTVLLAKIELC